MSLTGIDLHPPSSIAGVGTSFDSSLQDPSCRDEKLPVRVLMTTDTVGGVWNYSINLIRGLAPYGVQVILAAMGRRPSADQRHQAVTTSNLYLLDSDFKLEWMDDAWTDVKLAGEWLLEVEAKWRPALVHLNGYSHAPLPWHGPRLVVAHSCVLSWWHAVRGASPPGQWLTYAAHVARGLAAAELVVAPSAAMLAELRRLYRWSGEGMVIWNGLPANGRSPGFSKEDFILTVGRLWDEAKNLRAVEAVSTRLAWPIYAAGEGQASPHGGSVTRLGYLSAGEISEWMQRAAVYALPARYEPFGLSILEAARSECALVLGDIPSLRELWDGAAWFVPPDGIPELGDALATLIAEPNMRAEFAARASERARRYGIERMAKQYAAVYRKLLQGSRVPCI